ncbi:MAG TPA: chemotaxis protein CheW [Kineosporiaceae bacterium]
MADPIPARRAARPDTETRTEPGPAEALHTAKAGGGSGRYLTFTVSGQNFALPILDVTEIMEYRALTAVPMMPAFIRGVINLRGRVVPVLDLATRFGTGTIEADRRTSIIIVETGRAAVDAERRSLRGRVGLLVDAVSKVTEFGPQDVEPPPAFGGGIHADFISGMARHAGGFLIVLDVDHVLTVGELVTLGRTQLADVPTPAVATHPA